MDVLLFVKGVLIGLLISFPFGPIGLFCINRTLNNGRVSGFLSGMGVATADALFAVIAGLGVSFILQFIEERSHIFQLIGSLVVLLLGIRIFLDNPVKKIRYRSVKSRKFTWHYFSGLLLSLTNPLTIFTFLAVFTTLNLFSKDTFSSSLAIILGIFSGASVAWFLISFFVSRMRGQVRLKKIYWLNKIAGATIFIFGFIAILGFLIIK